jgi:hypothetical protein
MIVIRKQDIFGILQVALYVEQWMREHPLSLTKHALHQETCFSYFIFAMLITKGCLVTFVFLNRDV